MASLIYAPRAREDLARVTEFLAKDSPETAAEALRKILEALDFLREHPLLGHKIAHRGLRALVISRGKSGYVAHYVYREADDTIIVTGLRHQREQPQDG